MELSVERRELFDLRVERRRSDLVEGLEMLYGPDAAGQLADRLVELALGAYAERSHDLHLLDLRRSLRPDWLQQPEMVGYAAYTERFAGDLRGVETRIPYLRELGVSYLHLMPLLEPRDGDNDGGYAVRDYRQVRADLGTVDDLRATAKKLRENGISLVLDLVLNHVAREHEWAKKARTGDPRYREYFYTYPDRAEPDAFERTLPEVFPDFAPGSFTWDVDLDSWVWTTFNSWQWDLNWTNPEVLVEFAEIVLYLANLGVEVIRLDAIAFLWKRLGTTCQNEPEVHAITQVLRTVARIACPALAFKAEAIVAPHDLVQYLGTGRHQGKVSDLAYHNTLMVQIWSMLASADTQLAALALANLPTAPSTSSWITYVRCHDDIGWAISDADAAAVGLNGYHHRGFLSDWYSGLFPGSPAQGLVFQENPATGDRRISGTAASLTGLARAGSPEDIDPALGRYFLAHAIVYGWGGIPVLWSGDELGMPNDPGWATEPGHETDNRWAHRPRLDPHCVDQRADLRTVTGRVFTGLAHLGRVRASLPHLHASIPSEVLPAQDPGLLALLRNAPAGPMVCLYNLTNVSRAYPSSIIEELGLSEPWDAVSARRITPDLDGRYWLTPYAAWWLVGAP
ncbi:alpha-amylase family protein [Lapillicoccus sp.]|uniref:alpha-amylase family protein n=1 Tax=Lapillicoccus sp. TaxID=1909287 RepID=UPI003264DAC2